MKELKILQIIQKLTLHLKQCKYCIAGFIVAVLMLLPHNIQSSCDYTLDMNGYSLTAVGNITWVNNQPQYYGTVTIAGIKYVSTKAGQGLQGNSYQICTSSNGNAYYTLSNRGRDKEHLAPALLDLHSNNFSLSSYWALQPQNRSV